MVPNVPTPARRPSRGRIARGRLAGLCALLALGASATAANAQFAYGYGYVRPYPGPVYYENDGPPVSPRSVVFRLQDRGFTEIARPRFDGTAWVVDATNPAGARVRLYVDARSGGVIGRQRLDAPYYPSNRVARAAPGYGWTEDDVAARAANPDRLVPPGSIPLPGALPQDGRQAGLDRMPPPPRIAGRSHAEPQAPGIPAGAGDANPLGVNPDARGEAKGRPAPPRKTAKLTPPVKPAAPRAAPEAPAPLAAKAEPAANPAPEAAKPAPAAGPPAALNADKPAAPEKAVAEKAPAKDWQDPPASEPKRNVRVIGGATVVPGGGTEAPAGAN